MLVSLLVSLWTNLPPAVGRAIQSGVLHMRRSGYKLIRTLKKPFLTICREIRKWTRSFWKNISLTVLHLARTWFKIPGRKADVYSIWISLLTVARFKFPDKGVVFWKPRKIQFSLNWSTCSVWQMGFLGKIYCGCCCCYEQSCKLFMSCLSSASA